VGKVVVVAEEVKSFPGRVEQNRDVVGHEGCEEVIGVVDGAAVIIEL